MVVAMMLPLMVIPVRVTAFRSLWPRRHWAMATFLCGYVGIWMAAGVLGLALLAFLREFQARAHWLTAAVFLVAAAWQITALKHRCAAACHLTRPLAPVGWPARRDCLCFGAEHGFYCVGNCGVLMVAAMLSPLHRTMMVLATLLLAYERYRARPHERSIPSMLGLLALAHLF
jgi:predicted metal-binding membrane protein